MDQLLVERELAATRSLARALIMAGEVEVAGVVVDKAGAAVAIDADLRLRERPRFVSRAGAKLAHALDALEVEVTGSRALDVGASTGGFVDCLLQRGALEVIALDVGYGQLDQKLRSDPRVHVMERVNARYLTADDVPYAADLLTADVSFISLEKVLPAVVATLAPAFTAVVLVKPQFEAGRERVGKGGIVRDADRASGRAHALHRLRRPSVGPRRPRDGGFRPPGIGRQPGVRGVVRPRWSERPLACYSGICYR